MGRLPEVGEGRLEEWWAHILEEGVGQVPEAAGTKAPGQPAFLFNICLLDVFPYSTALVEY